MLSGVMFVFLYHFNTGAMSKNGNVHDPVIYNTLLFIMYVVVLHSSNRKL